VKTFQNPVYSGSFADPYVLKFRGEYYAYCTDFWSDGQVFGVLRSRDLIHWSEAGGAMKPLDHSPPYYWAPEVTYSNGIFYLYYSAGNEAQMELRVAVSDRPDGGFVDSGHTLTKQEFAIDAHVFIDDNGKRYLFYATDFLEHSHIGTGTVLDEMIDWYTLAGDPQPVTRAKYDWQVYDPMRKEKGNVRWHTVEGPFILKRKGIYYEMFSGGNWQNPSYGVSFAVTNEIVSKEEWQQFSDGEKVLPILRTVPERIVGPGHNSVVRGPNNRELYCIYHRWVEGKRVLAIDRMDFAGERIFIAGATDTPQIAPFAPSFSDDFDGPGLSAKWHVAGNWKSIDGCAICGAAGENELAFNGTGKSFLAEVSFMYTGTFREKSSSGFRLWNGDRKIFEFSVLPGKKGVQLYWYDERVPSEQFTGLPELNEGAFHLLRIEVDGKWMKLVLDDVPVLFEPSLTADVDRISLYANDLETSFSVFELTAGFEDLFDRDPIGPAIAKWRFTNENGFCEIRDKQLFLVSDARSEGTLKIGEFKDNYECAVNMRLDDRLDDAFSFGILIIDENETVVSRLSIEAVENGKDGAKMNINGEPAGHVQTDVYHQFRLTMIDGRLSFDLEGKVLGEICVPRQKTRAAIFYRDSVIALDMVRQTEL
jgi:GH43 family beta-xylosidase